VEIKLTADEEEILKLEKDVEKRQATIGKYQAANTLREA
jgi:hypothetical protein